MYPNDPNDRQGQPPGHPETSYAPPPWPAQQGYPPLQDRSASTNGYAITALVSSLVLAPLGIVFGHVALGQIRKTGEQGRGLAIGGLVIGYLVTAISVISIVAMVTVFNIFADHKPDINALTDGMVLNQSDFPSLPSGDWSRGVKYDYDPSRSMDVSATFAPSECAAFRDGRKGADEAGYAEWSSKNANYLLNWTYNVSISLPTQFEKSVMDRALDACGHFERHSSGTVVEGSSQRIDLSDVPDWAVAYSTSNVLEDGRTHTNYSMNGVYRGVFIEADYGPVIDTDSQLLDELPQLFNAQVKRLDSA